MITLLKQLVFRWGVNRRGSVFIISLWSLCMLSIFALNLNCGVRQKIALVKRLDEKDRLHFIAEAGIKKAITVLKKEEDEGYDSLNSRWAVNLSAFKDVQIGGGTFNICYDYIDKKSGSLEEGYGLVDEERKINVNKADRKVLQSLFCIVLGIDEVEAQELAASLIDWRDADSELSIPLGSAEDYYYTNLEYPYGAADSDFTVLEEMLLVKGMSEDVFNRIKGFVTIYGGGRININTAPKEVLSAVGLKAYIVDKILLYRQGEDGIPGTLDDNVFKRASSIVSELSQACHLSPSELAELSMVADRYLDTDSDNFMIRSVARLDNRDVSSGTVCIVDGSGKILYWRES